jgi:hypothetical protein
VAPALYAFVHSDLTSPKSLITPAKVDEKSVVLIIEGGPYPKMGHGGASSMLPPYIGECGSRSCFVVENKRRREKEDFP